MQPPGAERPDDLPCGLKPATGRYGGAPGLGDYRAIGQRVAEGHADLDDLVERGVGRVAAIVLSPQYSPLLMGGYQRAVQAARESTGGEAPEVGIAGAWYREAAFIEALAERIREGLARFRPNERASVPVLLTAHSLPRRVAEQEPDYLAQLHDTAEVVAEHAGLDRERWTFCWQSAAHEPGEWMKPDLGELMPLLRGRGHRSVLIAPVQFLADHLEVLYDLDVAARQQAEALGLRFERISSLNVEPRFIDALAGVAGRTLGVPVGG